MTTQTKHTPGPWAVAAHNCAMPGGTMASAITHGQCLTGTRFIAFAEGPDREANAALIAQAPDLLRQRDKLRQSLAGLEQAIQLWFEEGSRASGQLRDLRRIQVTDSIDQARAILAETEAA